MKHISILGFFTLLVCTTSTFAFQPIVVTPQGMEKCFGIADAGQNDGPFMSEYSQSPLGTGQSQYPCERTAWRWVPKGKCTTIMIGFKDGVALTGTLTPRPQNMDPEKCMPYTVFGTENSPAGSNDSNPTLMPGADLSESPPAAG